MGKDSKEPPAKKSRGRPVGSLNKPKAPGFNYSNDFNSLAEPQSLSQSIANATINKANAIKKEALIAAQQRDKQLGSSVSSSSFSSSSSSSTTTSQQHHLDNHQQLDADEISPLALQLEKKDDIKDKESSTKQPTPTLPQPPSSILKKPTLNSFKNNLNNNNSTLILPGGGGDQQLVLPGGQTDRSNTTTTNIISSSTTITNDANNASKQAAEEAAEEENDLEDDLGDLQGNLPITKNSEAMRLLLESMTEEQQDRYEVYRRAGFNKNEMKKLAHSFTGLSFNPTSCIILSGVAKVFVGELVEKAKEVMEEWGEPIDAAIRPEHLQEAHRSFMSPQNHYEVLGVDRRATAQQIRQAYIRESLKYHPDRCPADNRAEHEAKFKTVAEAFYVLSDPGRRNSYNANSASSSSSTVDPIGLFGSIFADLYTPEVDNPTNFWSPIGMFAGGALGFILFNIPGMVMGGYAGMQAGSVRDKKGKSVYEAFQALELGQRQTILANIAKRVLEVGITAQMATTTTANGDVKI